MKRLLFLFLFFLVSGQAFAEFKAVPKDLHDQGDVILDYYESATGGTSNSPWLTGTGIIYTTTNDFAVGGSTAAADLFVDDSAGQVGVKDLSIRGNTVIGDASGDTVTSNAATWTFANDTAVTLTGGLDGLNIDSNTLSIDATNNRVGFGIASPASPINVYQNTSSVDATVGVTIENAGAGDAVTQYVLTGTRRWVIGIDNSDSDKFKISATADLANGLVTIDTNGRMGVGDTTPDALFDVNGNVSASGNFEANRLRADTVIRAGNSAGTVDFNAIDDDSTVSNNSGLMNTSNDLYIEGNLEVDAPADFGSNVSISGNTSVSGRVWIGSVEIDTSGASSGDTFVFSAGKFSPSNVTAEWADSGTVLTTADAGRDVQIDGDLTIIGKTYLSGGIDGQGFDLNATNGYIKEKQFYDMSLDFDLSRSNGLNGGYYLAQVIAPFDMTIQEVQLFSDLTTSGDLTVTLTKNTTVISTVDVHKTNKRGVASSENDSVSSGDFLLAKLTGSTISTDLTGTGSLRFRYIRTSEL